MIGYAVAMLFVMFGAPDLAMTQLAIETLTVILFVFLIYRLPRFTKFASVLTGKSAVAITQHVLTEKHDLVLKTARPEEFSPRLFYGALAKKLLRVCPCPVWVIQPNQGEQSECPSRNGGELENWKPYMQARGAG